MSTPYIRTIRRQRLHARLIDLAEFLAYLVVTSAALLWFLR